MTMINLLNTLAERNIEIWQESGQLKFRAPKGAMDEALKQQLRQNKAALIEQLQANDKKNNVKEVVHNSRERYLPFEITPIQQAYLVGRSDALNLGGVAAHSYVELEHPSASLESTEIALNKVIQRHDMLRTVITKDGFQQVLQEVPFYTISCRDLRGASSDEVKKALKDIRNEMETQIRPADKWPLFDIKATLHDHGLRLHTSIDLMTLDAWSCQLMFREWFSLIEHHHLPSTPGVTFRDYLQYVHGDEFLTRRAEAKRYWDNELEGLPPAPKLPSAVRDKNHNGFHRLRGEVDAVYWQAFKQRCRQLNVTPSTAVMTLFAVTLSRWSTNEALTLNVTLFNRHPVHDQVQQILGEFTNNTLIDFDEMARPFIDQVRQVQDKLLERIEYSLVDGVDLLRQLARMQQNYSGALMPVVFTSLLMGEESTSFESLGWQEVYGLSQTPQVTFDHQLREENGKLMFNWDISRQALDVAAIEVMLEQYLHCLKELALQDDAWTTPPARTLPGEQAGVRNKIHSFEAGYSTRALTLQQPVLDSMLSFKERVAVIDGNGESLTYEELHQWCCTLAKQIRQQGVAVGDHVLVMLPKGAEQVAAVVACHMAGAVYVPLSIDTPVERYKNIISQANPALVLYSAQHPMPDISQLASLVVETSFEKELKTELNMAAYDGDHSAYIIFTSGSTGTPKGVEMGHGAVRNTLDDMASRFGAHPEDRTFALSALNFDLSVYDIFMPLMSGGSVLFPEDGNERNPEHWYHKLHQNQVTIWNSVPALLEMLVTWCESQNLKLPESLRLVLLSGDWVPLNLPQRIKAIASSARIVALGGATEAAIWSNWQSADNVPSHWASVPYGKPLTHQYYRVLDKYMSDRPDWVEGDLYIGGAGLAKSYWGDEAKTVAAFIAHGQERLYQTGDRARFWQDGTLEFLGRNDHQVKIGGHRIELGEIEHVLQSHQSVERVVVEVQKNSAQSVLVSYVVAQRSSMISPDTLKEYTAQYLPYYMVPRHIVLLPTLPLSANGKVDRKALPAIEFESVDTVCDLSRTMCVLKDILCETLQLSELHPDENFFEAGATSVTLVAAHGDIQKVLQKEFPVTWLFTYSCLRALDAELNNKKTSNSRQRREKGKSFTF
ncbi:Siderophore biosynthesis non-ribosomal peptide synthetase [Photobacterium marinum]|uniref:Siderophore biosynthesis non-ribosomal peptide synthetase n=1 Tax=Photobacterium marinum TaxID=1056511 RepID=L8JEY0_9GAMM|nr:non-ribosomal peptide synthetase [Photobacterium marinum]ELR66773.1 Siderophore biosynthesis non-ribosomal peptide synthetase [Photobacterium marinum]